MAAKTITRGSVVLIRYPFTDLSGTKLRPAVIVTPNDLIPLLDDILCAFVTTVIPDRALATDLTIHSTDQDFPSTGLRGTSVIRAHKLALLHHSLVQRHLGQMSKRLLKELDQYLKKAVGIKN
ncbi:MAG: type II toxin-antitoxin system PemK/MazF family toxin [bacterium]